MNTCTKCPIDDNCSFTCEYCTKSPIHEEAKNKPDTNNPQKDRSRQLIEDLCKNKLSITDLKDTELQYLSFLVQEEMVRREIIPLRFFSARRRSAMRRRRYYGFIKQKRDK